MDFAHHMLYFAFFVLFFFGGGRTGGIDWNWPRMVHCSKGFFVWTISKGLISGKLGCSKSRFDHS